MLRVKSHGNTIEVLNPVTKEMTRMVNVVFTEEGRGGADGNMSKSSDLLSRLVGKNVGLNNIRVHTQPVKMEYLNLFPIGAEMEGHINRGLFSTPQLRQQIDVDPREVDGKPTYFKTWISDKPEEDVDARISNDVMASVNPRGFFNARISGTTVKLIPNEAVGLEEL
jgi:hypothetical protein